MMSNLPRHEHSIILLLFQSLFVFLNKALCFFSPLKSFTSSFIAVPRHHIGFAIISIGTLKKKKHILNTFVSL